ncbi:IS3 family transposase [Paraburkholderia sp. CNPSo 3281]|uniref:IS3 family transposase n=1 Tax=Paraburkholderia sp. CNPSo 3281 TaxID=2940933 RepID=UPI0035CCD1E9
MGLSRAAYYKRPRKSSSRDDEIANALRRILTERHDWGFRRCFDEMRKQGFSWNHKRVYRIYCEMGLNRRFLKNSESISLPVVATHDAASDG